MNKQEFIEEIEVMEKEYETEKISIETLDGKYDCEIWIDENDDNCWFSDMLGNCGYRDLLSAALAVWDFIVEEEKSEILHIDSNF